MHYDDYIKESIKELLTFIPSDLKLLADSYNIPFNNEYQVAHDLARIITEVYNNDIVPPKIFQTSTDVWDAIRNRTISIAEGKEFLKKFDPSVTGTQNYQYSDCSNERDYITLDPWNEIFYPDVKIRFLNPHNHSYKSQMICMKLEDIKLMLNDERNVFRAWYTKIPSIMDNEGHGGSPSTVESYYKLLNFFISNSEPFVKGNYTGYPIYVNKRIGNSRGEFGVGDIHGQTPGHTIYFLIKNNQNVVEQLCKEINRMSEMKGYTIPFISEKVSIVNLINHGFTNIKDIIPVADT